MNDNSITELFEVYIDTLRRCTNDIRNRSDEEIWYDLFEEFLSGAVSFLHENTLEKLHEARLIDDEAVTASKEARKRWFELEQLPWTIEQIKTCKEWQELFDFCEKALRHSSPNNPGERHR